jgi:hypothetical protein
MPDVQLSLEVTMRISADAKHALDMSFAESVKRRRDMEHHSAAQQELAEAVIRNVMRDEQVKSAPALQPPTLQEALAELQYKEKGDDKPQAAESPTARALTMWPFRGIGDSQLRIAHDIPEDSLLQILVPPYADKWTSAQPSGNAEAYANADEHTGNFGFLDGAAGGSAQCAAGVWVQFIPDGPLPRLVEVRAYTPYNYQWDDRSSMGYSANNSAGFGIYILSWDMQGSGRRLEQDFRYTIWSDGTGWWDEHHNPSWDDVDGGTAYLYGNEAPYFEAQPGRIYRACIWCFGACDAGSGFFGNAVSASDINAQARLVVIGEQ